MIEIRNVSKRFKKGWYALKDVDLSIAKGDFLFLTGTTGSGKTTLLRLIYMDLFPDKGEVAVAGFIFDYKRRRNTFPAKKNRYYFSRL